MGKSLIYKMRCGCEFWEGLDYVGEVYPEMQYCTKHDDLVQIRNRIAELEESIRLKDKMLEHLKDAIGQ